MRDLKGWNSKALLINIGRTEKQREGEEEQSPELTEIAKEVYKNTGFKDTLNEDEKKGNKTKDGKDKIIALGRKRE